MDQLACLGHELDTLGHEACELGHALVYESEGTLARSC